MLFSHPFNQTKNWRKRTTIQLKWKWFPQRCCRDTYSQNKGPN